MFTDKVVRTGRCLKRKRTRADVQSENSAHRQIFGERVMRTGRC